MSAQYRDNQGRTLFVCDGISDGRNYATYHRKPSGSLKRLKSKFLPDRRTRDLAQRDLDTWAKERKFEEVGKP